MDYCPQCGTENAPMGALGRLNHYRCAACGWMYSEPVSQYQEDPEADNDERRYAEA